MFDGIPHLELKPELGQVLTPDSVASKMVQCAAAHLPQRPLSVLDPAVGPATFPKAIEGSKLSVKHMDCYDLDHAMCSANSLFSEQSGLNIHTNNGDYLLEGNQVEYDFIILNPPYIRHESLDLEYKSSIKEYLRGKGITQINGRSNLFIYFLYKCLTQLATDGVMCAIVYDSILYTQYGQEFLKHVRENYSLLECESTQAPFDGAIIDASILIIKNSVAPPQAGILGKSRTPKGFVSLSELMTIRRGTALPSRKAFLANKEDGKAYSLADPIIMKPKNRKALIIKEADSRYYNIGNQKIVDALLERRVGAEKKFLQSKFSKVSGNILLNYYIRSEPRHILNPVNHTASDNFYVSCAKHDFPDQVAWLLLNSSLYKDSIMKSARNQGNGLRKLQVYEYKNACVPDWRNIPASGVKKICIVAKKLMKSNASGEEITKASDGLVREVLK